MLSLIQPHPKRIIGLVLFLLLIGHAILFSATGVLGLERHGSEFYFVTRQALVSVIGIVLMLVLSNVPYQHWKKFGHVVLLVEILLVAAVLIPGVGHSAQGARRWLLLKGFLFQPSELAKIVIPIYAAKILAIYHERGLSPKAIFFHCLPVFVLLGLIFRQPDLGTTTLLVLCILAMLFIGGIKLFYLASFLGLGAIGFAVSLLHSEYRRRRLFAFLNPWADPQGTGFQSIQSFLSFYSGRLFGAGIGNGNSKLFYLPEVHTDFIFALVGEELGFVGAMALLLLFVYFSFLLFRSVTKSRDLFGNYLAFGLAFSLVIQIAVNLGGVTGILPMKGLTLPFISWGRSALLSNLCMVGILLNILKQSLIIPEEKKPGKGCLTTK